MASFVCLIWVSLELYEKHQFLEQSARMSNSVSKSTEKPFQNITVKNTSKQNCHSLFVKKTKCKYFCIHYQILCYPLKHLVCSFVYLPRACRHFVYIPPIQGCFTIQNDVKHAHLIYYLVIFPLIKHIFDSHWCDPDIAFPLFSL